MSDSVIITFALIAAVTGIAYGLYLAMWVFKLDAGNQKMQDIAKAIQEGASAYLNRQYKTVAVVAAVLFAILWGAGAFSDKFGLLTAVGFLIGAGASSLAGYVGMVIAVRANVRTAQAAHQGMNSALTVAFRGGAVTGLLLIGLGLLAITLFYYLGCAVCGAGEGNPCVTESWVRRQFDFGIRPCGRRYLYQSGGRRRRPRRESRSGNSGRRSSQPGCHCRQRGRQCRRLRRYGRGPLRNLCGDDGGGDGVGLHTIQGSQRTDSVSSGPRRRHDLCDDHRYFLRESEPGR